MAEAMAGPRKTSCDFQRRSQQDIYTAGGVGRKATDGLRKDMVLGMKYLACDNEPVCGSDYFVWR